jgi:ATP-binding cassette subfamily F protein 3
VLGNYLFSGEDVFKKIAGLSGGEKARVSLAKLMLLNANVLILDEPTNHLDLYSKEVLEASLIDYEGTLLFISHDRYFLNKMAERIVELTPQGIDNYLGNYDDYVEKKQELSELQAERLANMSKKELGRGNGAPGSGRGGDNSRIGGAEAKLSDYEAEKLSKREERSKQRKIEQLEQDIARMEAEVEALEAELAQPDVYNNYVLVQEKNTAIEQTKALLQQSYEEWETLM